MIVLAMIARVVTALGGQVDAPVVALGAAINAALTIPDVVVWNSVFAKLGSFILPGGRYIRPFVSGSIPWLIAAPFMYAISFWIGSTAYATLFAK